MKSDIPYKDRWWAFPALLLLLPVWICMAGADYYLRLLNELWDTRIRKEESK